MGTIEILYIIALLICVVCGNLWMHQIYVDGNGTSSGDNGLIRILQRFASGDFHYHLFTNNFTVTAATVLTDLTELSATGYTLQTVTAAAFTLVGVASHNGSIMAAPIGFGTNSSGGSVSTYGYYITDTANTTLLAATNWDTLPTVTLNGGSWPVVVPVFGDFSQFTS